MNRATLLFLVAALLATRAPAGNGYVDGGVTLNFAATDNSIRNLVSVRYLNDPTAINWSPRLIGEFDCFDESVNVNVRHVSWGVDDISFSIQFNGPQALPGHCYFGETTGSFTCSTCWGGPVNGGPFASSNECAAQLPASGGPGGCTIDSETGQCVGTGGGSHGFNPNYQECNNNTLDCVSPIILNLGRGSYDLTDVTSGVDFDLDDDGRPDHAAWTAAGAPLAFLALDHNGNGRIDDGSELFGDHTPSRMGGLAANGFAALAELDSNHDRMVDLHDAMWPRLLLWTDANHNGISEADELSTLATSDIKSLRFDNHWTGRSDGNGNVFQYQSKLATSHGERTYYDIYLRVAR